MLAHWTPLLWLCLSLWHFIPGFLPLQDMGSVHACTHFTDNLPEARSCISQSLSWFFDPMGNVNFWGGCRHQYFPGWPSLGGGTTLRYFRCTLHCFVATPACCSCPTWCPVSSQLMWNAPALTPPSTLCPPNKGGESPATATNQKPQWRSPLWSPQPWVVVKIVLGFSWSHRAGGGSVSPPGGITRHMLPGALAGRGKRSSRPASGRPRRWKPDQRGAQTV